MSFTEVLKGANRGRVSTIGLKPAQVSFPYFRLGSVANHTTYIQKLAIKTFLESR